MRGKAVNGASCLNVSNLVPGGILGGSKGRWNPDRPEWSTRVEKTQKGVQKG